MNHYCRNCGERLSSGEKVCPKCEAEVFDSRIDVEEKKQEMIEEKEQEKKYIAIMIIFAVLNTIASYMGSKNQSLFSSFGPLFALVFIITLIYARIKLPQSKMIQIIFIIVLAGLIAYFVAVIYVFLTCTEAINGRGI